jgi:predicted nucleic acid-binding protein
MKQPGKIVDANVILRFFLQDDDDQFLKARSFIQKLELGKDEAFLTDIVFAEVVWVLRKVYEIHRLEISEKFSKLINYRGVKTFFSKELYTEALKLYAKHSTDIQDILLALLARQTKATIVTFDKTDFKKLPCGYEEPGNP